MSELLAPAGSMESLKAAISNGCNAVYLGMQKYGARAYSSNFDEDTLKEAVDYAHLRDVKVYATMNTIVFEDELPEAYEQLHFLNEVGVDGVIVQDLAILTYIAEHFEDMEAHCSTQMGIDDVEGALLCKELGVKRSVIGREVPLDKVKEIRKQADLPVEIFIHGALCVSYSGNCIMSSLTGNRSGNRGRCIGSCRKLYTITDTTENKVLGQNYILSTKDLNTIDYVDQFEGIDSLKIEGRMKEPVYVANVVSRYRKALDGTASAEDKEKLNRTFNRTYTKGYLFGEDRKDITNIEKPNHHGYEIGVISGVRKGMYEISLSSPLSQNDVIRIRHNNEDVNLSATKLFDEKGRLINGSESKCYIRIKEKLSSGDKVYKTKDIAFNKELESMVSNEFKRFPVSMKVSAYPDAPLIIEAEGLGCTYTYVGDDALSEAINKPTTKESVVKQLSKLNDTIFVLDNVEYEDCNAFIPVKLLNEARRTIVENLYQLKVASKPRATKETQPKEAISFPEQAPYLTAAVTTQEQYDVCKECGIETVYFKNIIPRNGNTYTQREGKLLIGGMGGVCTYRNSNPFVADYSLNSVNSKSVYELHRLGAKRVTLSYEMNEWELRSLIENYRANNGGSPCLEMIVYGRAPLLVTKYCPLKKMDQCSNCRKHQYEIKDEFGSFPLLMHSNCDTTVLNGKILNLLDEIPSLEGIEAFRLNFTLETPEEIRSIIAKAQRKLEGDTSFSAFNSKTDTRGHFNREIL